MRSDARADLLMQAQRPLALDELQKDVFQIVQDADVAALADVVDEVLQDQPDGRRLVERAQRHEGEPGQPRADGIALARPIADDQLQRLELAEHAMHGLSGKAEPGRQVGQPYGLRLIADSLQNRQRFFESGGPTIAGHS